VPHAIALDSCGQRLVVADRENSKVAGMALKSFP
jgi:hypothetical protein